MESAQSLFQPPALPANFADYYQRHAGETMLVCGCGNSLNQLHDAEHFLTIGVNDIGRKFHPDYLVVLNSRHQFTPERFAHIEQSQAKAIFSHLALDIAHPGMVRFMLGQYGGVEINDRHSLPYTRNSTYVAACLAMFMGAKRVGFIGMDFTDHHFFAQTGRHSLSHELPRIRQEYARLVDAAARHGVELVNLSQQSAVDTLPYQPLSAFSHQAKSTKSLNIVSYATTPVVGVPKLLSECIEHCTPHRCRTVWATNHYGNGVRFEREVEWEKQPDIACALLEAADLLIVHNGFTAPQHKALLANKPVITLAHNYISNVDRQFVARGMPGLVVAQYQAALEEFAQWQAVPNPVPLWNPLFDDAEKEATVTIAYTPSVKHDEYPANHRLYWHGKGYQRTMAILRRLAQRYPLRLLTLEAGQVDFTQSMEMKRRAHIVIDECVTGSYHRNSLEGLAAGAVVVNGLGLKPDIAAVLQRCTPDASSPFVCASLDTLENVLSELIELGAQHLRERGLQNRAWLQQHWDFAEQWPQFWLPAIQALLGNTHSSLPPRAPLLHHAPAMPHLAAPAELDEGVSVIVPFAGEHRLAALQCMLTGLKQQPDVRRVLVVELDNQPHAQAVATELADDYLFACTSSPFSKARALNIALPFVHTRYLLWLDADLLLPQDFIRLAWQECERRQLDCLIPWSTINFLSEEESRQVQAEQRRPEACSPVFQQRSGAQGGAVLARTDFALRHGGMDETFVGWGGEDNAWFHKASVLGTAAFTHDTRRPLWHLYHPLSAGYCRQQEHIAANPYYSQNVQRLQQLRTVRHGAAFSQHFPPPAKYSAPWDGSVTIVCPAEHTVLAQRLHAMYGEALRVVTQPEQQAISPALSSPDTAPDILVEQVIKAICTHHAQHAASPGAGTFPETSVTGATR
ncbi:glycosyltransferase [Cedecea neteri]|uniref:glycosyltransferase n=1 Tax=Cedecea neteri TaxID=158822 RepID=UPI0028932C54|nr:glycosyltransferase [Cedecea neteri]WNJ78491.1 glycosyltransferase [Cedecea neteri]